MKLSDGLVVTKLAILMEALWHEGVNEGVNWHEGVNWKDLE